MSVLIEGINMMNHKSRYRQGEIITSLDELLEQDAVYHNEHYTHRGWFLSWQINYTLSQIKKGRLKTVIENKDNKGETK